MFKIFTMQSVAAVAFAAVLASAAVLLTSIAPPANARPQLGPSNEALAKAAAPTLAVTVSECSARSWPNYYQGCLRSSDRRQVRVINLETQQARAH
jgi:hypothetical protein